MKRRTFWGTLSILIMALIYYFSADNAAASNQKSDSVFTLLYPLVSAWLSEDQLVFAVRKGAHFLIYAALGMCMFQFFKTWNCSFGRTVIFTLAVCFCYACSDEFHQLFISGRSGQWSDVWLDTAGAGTAVLLTHLFTICRNREKTG